MRILLLTPQLPYPPHKGTSIRNFNILKHLARSHDITLLSLRETGDIKESAILEQYCTVEYVEKQHTSSLSRLANLLAPGRPDLVYRLYQSEMVSRVRKLLAREPFDLVQIEGLEMARHWEVIVQDVVADRLAIKLPAAILDDHNAEHVLQRRAHEIDRAQPSRVVAAAYSLIQWHKLSTYERHFCRMVSGVVAASELDRQSLLSLDKRLRIEVVPNGVDTAYYSPRFDDRLAHLRVVFSGTMDFRPNVDGVRWFCRNVWPAVLSRIPQASFWIVGRDPRPDVKALADGEHVVVTGAVDDIRPFLADACLAVVPLRIGGGSRLKVLEAMACGLPVVSTTLGCEGISVNHENAVLADNPMDLSAAICELLLDPNKRRRHAGAARSLVEREYDWKVIVPRLECFQRKVVEG